MRRPHVAEPRSPWQEGDLGPSASPPPRKRSPTTHQILLLSVIGITLSSIPYRITHCGDIETIGRRIREDHVS